ncbi:LysM peptidoglycan-binding domain-containing protein [Brevibacterium album]|uniref:LysM peptidoglycan-binding domain-containing protein n=1 Tax=Brevibacterium album TaxID=417948 RepID=UPI000400EA10|nr:LysM peptidoglycan-binding domain-containing protein [Brevibacterium album]
MSALAVGRPALRRPAPGGVQLLRTQLHRICAGSPRRSRLLRTAVLALALLALLGAVLAGALTSSAAAGDERPAVETAAVVVSEGENLWEIVAERGYDRDPRAVIEEIRALNGLATSVVHPGQRIEVPAR